MWVIEVEPEVLNWLETLPQAQYDKVDRHADKLLAEPTTLGEPFSKHLGGKVRELRITYWLAPERRIVLLTVFRKSRQREDAQVERAQQALKECKARHGPAEHTYDRKEES
ncbi:MULTISPECIES: type II toxin-antitoxin system RelE/ParE family toxin [Streptomyces]|uniref:type II toxin-antitoxin system RelE/ParE family toxin n=1 Tax=Streptomyces TaxID=1883 RepID=UPI0006AE11A9|nr:type II toxin-antitoxin system RelE/ParE family toxin [Streptomyces sp. NRRL F-7442]KOX42418.1 toxin-antitoxin system, toxin component, RelE family protein [Streptomyces sp. NRRL F-7442]